LQGTTLKKNTNPQETFSGKPFAPGRTGYVINADIKIKLKKYQPQFSDSQRPRKTKEKSDHGNCTACDSYPPQGLFRGTAGNRVFFELS
jgi:hypothetical protein